MAWKLHAANCRPTCRYTDMSAAKTQAMPSTSLLPTPAARRLRAASSAVHGGASSLLRLARTGDARLPSGAALSGWADRAAAMLDLTPMMVGPQTATPRPAAVPGLRESAQHRGARA
jgi:hypothetical protein